MKKIQYANNNEHYNIENVHSFDGFKTTQITLDIKYVYLFSTLPMNCVFFLFCSFWYRICVFIFVIQKKYDKRRNGIRINECDKVMGSRRLLSIRFISLCECKDWKDEKKIAFFSSLICSLPFSLDSVVNRKIFKPQLIHGFTIALYTIHCSSILQLSMMIHIIVTNNITYSTQIRKYKQINVNIKIHIQCKKNRSYIFKTKKMKKKKYFTQFMVFVWLHDLVLFLNKYSISSNVFDYRRLNVNPIQN